MNPTGGGNTDRSVGRSVKAVGFGCLFSPARCVKARSGGGWVLSMVGGSALFVLWMGSAVLLKLRTAGRGGIYSGGRSGSFDRESGWGSMRVGGCGKAEVGSGGKGHVWRGERGEVVGSRKVGEARGHLSGPGDWTGPREWRHGRPQLNWDRCLLHAAVALGRRGSCVAVQRRRCSAGAVSFMAAPHRRGMQICCHGQARREFRPFWGPGRVHGVLLVCDEKMNYTSLVRVGRQKSGCEVIDTCMRWQ